MTEFHDHLIPFGRDEAISRGWPTTVGGIPRGVTWHWTATRDLATARRIIGPGGLRAGAASAHYAIGRTFAEGVDRYVPLQHRSWHAGVGQTLRWDGAPATRETKGSRACIGVETVHIGFARRDVEPRPGWLTVAGTGSRHLMQVPPWPDEQVEMMIAVGREIQETWPHLRPEDHHGHHDLCPGYKEDVSAAFPFARVLRGIYPDMDIPDVWQPFRHANQRQWALKMLRYDLGAAGIDDDWGRMSDAALRAFQRDAGLVDNGQWTTFTARAAHAALVAGGHL